MDSKASQASVTNAKWWSSETVAVVTGANKGIGLALVGRLAELGLTVVLTSRDSSKGRAAVESLRSMGLVVVFAPLDVSDPASIEAFVSWLKSSFGGLDILVNNAGVSFNGIKENTVEHAETVIDTNFYGPKRLTEALLPLFRRSTSISRILNMSSQLGLLSRLRNPSLKRVLQDEKNLSEEAIKGLTSRFLEDVRDGTWRDRGWPKVWTDYAVSKLALNAYSRFLARRCEGRGLSVNCYCPGFTRTSMTGGEGVRTAEEAAAVAAGILLLPPWEVPNGKFFVECSNTPTLYSRL
ncbi:(+)-neomenthol dehydrogenase [Acorus calamus]|uniref:(+)-neomenthol dehydrogenase n=1 Tax=Acorus calamus TaxID=4465 RepID=A0AAV9F149_ACOCL|nr:(+)-neomenthol dehydrogenase [Acorus calamus]